MFAKGINVIFNLVYELGKPESGLLTLQLAKTKNSLRLWPLAACFMRINLKCCLFTLNVADT